MQVIPRNSNVHPKVVQERLGHGNIAMTLDVYSHVLPSMQQEAAGKQGLTVFWLSSAQQECNRRDEE